MSGDDKNPDPDEHGVPYCTQEKCVQYDGKRCQLLGHRPGYICEPAVQDMAHTLRVIQAAAKLDGLPRKR